MKTYRFFYHYNRQFKRLTVHFKGQCIPVDGIHCSVPCESKRNKRQPFFVMRGFARRVEVKYGTAFIS